MLNTTEQSVFPAEENRVLKKKVTDKLQHIKLPRVHFTTEKNQYSISGNVDVNTTTNFWICYIKIQKNSIHVSEKKNNYFLIKKKKFAKNSIRFLIKYILDEGNFGGLKHTQNILRMASSN